MAAKYVHTCERCGQQAHLKRVGNFGDDDFYELWQEYSELEQAAKREIARAELALSKALQDAEEWRWLASHWQFIAERSPLERANEQQQPLVSECPF